MLMPVVIEYLHDQGYEAYSILQAARPFAKRTVLGKIVHRLASPRLHQPLLWQVFYHLSTLYRLKFYAKHPRLIRQVMAYQRRRSVPAEDRRYALHWFFHLVGYYEFLQAHAGPDEVLILDEGFIHRVVQLHASEVAQPDPAEVLAYVDLLPQPDLVITPRAPLEVCLERIYCRGLWERFSQKSPQAVSRFMGNADQVVNLAVDHIRNRGWNVIEVDNSSASPGPSQAELKRKLSMLSLITYRQSQLHPTVEY